MIEPTDLEILSAMRKYGGSFACSLGKLGQLSDDDNLRRIRDAWPDLWSKYREFALMDRTPKEVEK